jgi:signal transduction histidine kinase
VLTAERIDVHARIAWVVLGLSAFAAILDTVFTAAHRSLLSEATWADHGWPLAPLAAVGCALMGALIISRYPKQPLGWLLCAASLLSVTLAADAYSVWMLDGDGPSPSYWAHAAAWASPLLGWPAFTALIMVFLLSPDGHLPSPRWRWAVWVSVAGLVLHTLGTLTVRPGEFVYGEQYGYRSISAPLLNLGVLLVAIGLIAAAASLAWRLRRAADDVRRQLLWIASSAVFLAIGVVVVLLVPRLQGEAGTWLAGLPLRLGLLAVPLCVAVAVLRHRLLEIDLIVNRALVFALAAVLVLVGYVFVVVMVGLIVGGVSGGSWPSLLATALVAWAFQPLRRRVVRVADRLAFGAAAVPYEALADFSRRLGDSPDPADLSAAVAEAAARAVNASRVIVSLHVRAGPDQTATWPQSGVDEAPAAGVVSFPVVDRGERLGNLSVDMPAGHPLRPREQRLLADLGDQAAMAFRSVRLTAELAGEVALLADRTRELAESRLRLITVSDAERSRLERAVARQVITHIAPIPRTLRYLSDLDPRTTTAPDAALLGPLVASLNTALAALRDITQGVFPAQLARSGLPTALGSLLSRAGPTVRLVVEDSAVGRRFESRVEAAAYFCVAEATRDQPGIVTVVMSAPGEHLQLVITGSDRDRLPLSNMRDRVDAADGSLLITEKDELVVIEIRGPTLVAAP